MHLKRYRQKTMREALASARAELGPDALVLSTRMVGDRGWRGWIGQRVVEITAASNRDMSETRLAERPLRQPALPHDAPALPAASCATPLPDTMTARLCAIGLDRALAADIVRSIPATRRRDASAGLLRRAVADRLGTLVSGDEPFAAAEVFVGPPGVGKTTTIAKIASQERARRGVRLGLLAADGFRVGAIEQLRLYADIIGAPFSVARTPSELEAALAAAGAGPVLVDTAGRSVRDPHAKELLAVLAGRPGIRTHLVMSAAMPLRDAARLLDAYSVGHVSRVVLTRLDESESVAPLIGLLRDRGLPVSFLGTGQRVPEDLERATAAALAAHVLGEEPEPAGGRA